MNKCQMLIAHAGNMIVPGKVTLGQIVPGWGTDFVNSGKSIAEIFDSPAGETYSETFKQNLKAICSTHCGIQAELNLKSSDPAAMVEERMQKYCMNLCRSSHYQNICNI
jgi:hypothetical protein